MAGAENGGKATEKLLLWVGRLSGLVAVLWGLSSKFTGLEEQGKAVLAELSKRPTAEDMKTEIFHAVKPIEIGMARVEAELRALADRVHRLENSNK